MRPFFSLFDRGRASEGGEILCRSCPMSGRRSLRYGPYLNDVYTIFMDFGPPPPCLHSGPIHSTKCTRPLLLKTPSPLSVVDVILVWPLITLSVAIRDAPSLVGRRNLFRPFHFPFRRLNQRTAMNYDLALSGDVVGGLPLKPRFLKVITRKLTGAHTTSIRSRRNCSRLA